MAKTRENQDEKQSELTDLLCAIKSVGELNNFKQSSIKIFDTGAVYLYDDKELISRWNTPQEFIARNYETSGLHALECRSKHWVCEECGGGVYPANVTFEETHEGCGGVCS